MTQLFAIEHSKPHTLGFYYRLIYLPQSSVFTVSVDHIELRTIWAGKIHRSILNLHRFRHPIHRLRLRKAHPSVKRFHRQSPLGYHLIPIAKNINHLGILVCECVVVLAARRLNRIFQFTKLDSNCWAHTKGAIDSCTTVKQWKFHTTAQERQHRRRIFSTYFATGIPTRNPEARSLSSRMFSMSGVSPARSSPRSNSAQPSPPNGPPTSESIETDPVARKLQWSQPSSARGMLHNALTDTWRFSKPAPGGRSERAVGPSVPWVEKRKSVIQQRKRLRVLLHPHKAHRNTFLPHHQHRIRKFPSNVL